MHLPTGGVSLLSASLFLLSNIISSTTALPTADTSFDAAASFLAGFAANNRQLTNCPLNPPPALPPSSLPAIGYGLTLKHILLGRGTQNYTCDTRASSPTAAGALATLYDVSCLAASQDSRSLLDNVLLPALLTLPSNQIESFLASNLPAANAGIHYFRDSTTPYFGLNNGMFIAAGKIADAPAPAGARGNQNGAAVDWLKLAKKPTEPNGGLQEVYRVVTAGGRAPAKCDKKGVLTVDYVAQYWMYG